MPQPPLSRYEELVGVLMTSQERIAWARLRTDSQRQAFVDRFWVIRDPTPGTQANELRTVFMRRARRAAELFAEGSVPGYATDRGRVLMVYGLPDEQELRALPPGTRARVVWTYKEMAHIDEVQFVESERGFELDSEVVLDTDAFLGSAESELRLLLATVVGGARAALQYAEDSGDSGEDTDATASGPTGAAEDTRLAVAPEVRIWMQMVFSGTMREEIGLQHRVDFYPSDQGTYTVLAFQVGKDDLEFVAPDIEQEEEEDEGEEDGEDGAQVALQEPVEEPNEPVTLEAHLKLFGAVLEGEPGHENTIHQFIAPFTLDSNEGDEHRSALRTIGVTLVPGSYRLAWGVYDPVTGRASTRDEPLVVPDFAVPGLQLSRVIIARPPHGTEEDLASPDRVYRGIRLGSMLLHDDLQREVGRDETVEVVVIVSGWQSDPAAPGKPQLEVEYRLLAQGESIVRLPAQVLDFAVLGQQIPLAQIDQIQPGETYELEIRVRDLISGAEIIQTTPLHIRPDVETGDERRERSRG